MPTSIASAPHTPAREMRRASRVALALAIASAIAFAPLARAERATRVVDDARDDGDDPVLSFGQRYVPGETLESLDGPESRAAAAVGDEFIVPGSIWAQALDEGEEVVARTGAGEGKAIEEREEKVFAPATAPKREMVAMPREPTLGQAREMVGNGPFEPHGERFAAWMRRQGVHKLKRYCGDAAPPCAESVKREKIFLDNVAKVDAHNANVPKGGMVMKVGKFADMTEEEFERQHVAYERRAHKQRRVSRHRTAELGRSAKRVVEEKPAEEPVAEEPKQPRRRRARVGAKRTVEESPPPPPPSPPTPQPRAGARRGRKRTPRQTEPEVVTTKHDENAAASLGLDVRFVHFVARYGKQTQYCPDGKYPCEEAFRRQKVFLKNLNDIEMTNKKGGMKKRVTRFADLENEEFARDHATYADAPVSVADQEAATTPAPAEPAAIRRRRRGLPRLGDLSSRDLAALHAARPHSKRPRMSLNTHRSVDPSTFNTSSSSLGRLEYTSRGFPESFDWRDKIDIGPIYSQGMCSGCWAFTTAQVVGDSKAIATGTRLSVSPHHLLSCDNLDSACNTGNMATAYAWINVQPKGVLLASDFPEGSSCTVVDEPGSRGVKIHGYCEIPPLEGESTILNLMRAVKQQSVAVGVNIKPLQLYGGGIVRMHDCPPADINPLLAINHAAVLVGWGYDKDSNQPYWILKNSYDADWGEDGYAKLSMELGENGYGTCGLYTEQNYPLTDGRSCAEGSSEKWSVKRGNDIYLEPDDVLILPNGKGLITPFKFEIFGFNLTSTLQLAAMVCFSLCFVLVLIEAYFCMFPELDSDNETEEDPGGSVGAKLLQNAEEGSYGAQT